MKPVAQVSELITEMLEVFQFPTPSALNDKFRLKLYERDAKALANKDSQHRITLAVAYILQGKFADAEAIVTSLLSGNVLLSDLPNIFLAAYSMATIQCTASVFKSFSNQKEALKSQGFWELYWLYFRFKLRFPCDITAEMIHNQEMREKFLEMTSFQAICKQALQTNGVSEDAYFALLDWLYGQLNQLKFIVVQVFVAAETESIEVEVLVLPPSLDAYVDLSSDFADKKLEIGLPADAQIYIRRVTDDRYSDPSFEIAPIDPQMMQEIDSILGLD